MAAQEFTTKITFTTADYEAMVAAVRDGVGEQLRTIMNPDQARVLGRLVATVIGSITAADVGSTVKYGNAEWVVAATMHAGKAQEVVVLDDPAGIVESVVLAGADVEQITAPDGGDLLWLIHSVEPVVEALDPVIEDVPPSPPE